MNYIVLGFDVNNFISRIFRGIFLISFKKLIHFHMTSQAFSFFFTSYHIARLKKLACQNNSESDAIGSFLIGPPKIAKSRMRDQTKNDPPYKTSMADQVEEVIKPNGCEDR